MKNFKKTLMLSFLIALTSISSKAQDKDSPWVFGLGTNIVDVNAFGLNDVGDQFKDYLGTSDWNILPVLSRLSVARYIGSGFSLDVAGSINTIYKIPGSRRKVDDKTYYSLDLGSRYDLNNAFGETGWFDPYVKLGVGAAWVEDDMAGVLSGSLGFNTWFTDNVGLNFESAYKASSAFGDNAILGSAQYIGDYHFQHSISLVLRFGKHDADGDGVSDKDDICPDVAGPKELSGCPDSDNDGIADKDDNCPNDAGKESTNGCPDSDNDGVIDSKDKCPNKAGKFNGCPDSDGDRVPDHKDDCVDVKGPKKNKGCPWADSDNDGVKDNKDKCVNVAGPKSNGGCPVKVVELSADAEQKLGKYAKTIQFNSGKADFKPGVINTLDAIAGIMKEFKDVNFNVEGHSDSAGDDNKNLALSQRRAQAVVDYLASHGISGSRLHAVGFGEAKPIATNKTRAGRAENRRVVLTALH